jgi:hypothetical protein
MPDYSKKVKAPDPETINLYGDPARVSTMTSALGAPKYPLSSDCENAKASDRVKALLQTRSVGPFRVTGIRPFLDLLTRAFDRVKASNPDLYAALGTAGVLCVRYVRGSATQPSNHSWGTAIDISVLNPKTGQYELDLPLGDGMVQGGTLELHDFFRQEALASGEWVFWGAGFSREDGMHFEASDQLIRMWQAQRKV